MYDWIWITLLFAILAYFVGSFNFSLILTKWFKVINIREVGSKNAGATNALRAYGWKTGLLVFIADVSKAYWFLFSLGMIEQYLLDEKIYVQLTGIFLILGHIFPIYFNFKGGKGASCMLGILSAISIILATVGAILFLLIVYYTKYVSLGSIVVPYLLAPLVFIPGFNSFYDSAIHAGADWISFISIFLASIVVSISHRNNIIRLINGTERKLGQKK